MQQRGGGHEAAAVPRGRHHRRCRGGASAAGASGGSWRDGGESWAVGRFPAAAARQGAGGGRTAASRSACSGRPIRRAISSWPSARSFRNRVTRLPEGSFEISDDVAAHWERPTIAAVTAGADGLAVTGRLSGPDGGVRLSARVRGLRARTSCASPLGVEDEAAGVNRIALRLGSSAEEGFFGFGLQLTYFNQKGNLLPILVQEHGIGRGRRIVTRSSRPLCQRWRREPLCHRVPGAAVHHHAAALDVPGEPRVFDLRPAPERPVRREGLVGGDDRAHPLRRDAARSDRGLYRLCRPDAAAAGLGAPGDDRRAAGRHRGGAAEVRGAEGRRRCRWPGSGCRTGAGRG